MVPQPLPVPDGVPKSTTFEHADESLTSVMSAGQLTSQVAGETVTEAVKVLSVSNNSFVSLSTVAVLDTTEPGDASESTLNTNVNCEVDPAGKVSIVQVETPPAGAVQVKVGPGP
jgi:hypothetical protein